jgi:hypothetical protein
MEWDGVVMSKIAPAKAKSPPPTMVVTPTVFDV